MPSKPKVPCRHPGCSALVPSGTKYCDTIVQAGELPDNYFQEFVFTNDAEPEDGEGMKAEKYRFRVIHIAHHHHFEYT